MMQQHKPLVQKHKMMGKLDVVTTMSRLEDLPKDIAPIPSVLCVQAMVLSREGSVQSSIVGS
jgi:hypothetical protein